MGELMRFVHDNGATVAHALHLAADNTRLGTATATRWRKLAVEMERLYLQLHRAMEEDQ